MTVFPKIKKALIRKVEAYPPLGTKTEFAYANALKEERRSRSEWAKALLKELSFFQPSGVMLKVLNVHLARVKSELKRVAEEDEK